MVRARACLPQKGAELGRRGLLGGFVHGKDCHVMWVLGSLLLRGTPEDRLGLLGNSDRGGGPLLMRGTGLLSLPQSWEGCEQGQMGDSEAVSSFSGGLVALGGGFWCLQVN